jgi:hypothetical protein
LLHRPNNLDETRVDRCYSDFHAHCLHKLGSVDGLGAEAEEGTCCRHVDRGSQVELDHRQHAVVAALLQLLDNLSKDRHLGVAGTSGLAAAVEGRGNRMDHMEVEDSSQEEEAGRVHDSHMDNEHCFEEARQQRVRHHKDKLRRRKVEGRQAREAMDASGPSRRSLARLPHEAAACLD